MNYLAVGAGTLLAVGTIALARRLWATSLPAASSKVIVFEGRRVFVHVPNGLRTRRAVLYFHGHGASIDAVAKTLVPRFDQAQSPAILIIPQLGPKSEPGTLADVGAVARLLRAAVEVPIAQLDILAHSGGYVAAAAAVDRGGVVVSSLGLLDALYGQLPSFEAFARKAATRHLANVYGPSTAAHSQELAHDLSFMKSWTDAKASAKPQPALLRAFRVSTFATSVFHPSVPEVYGASMIDAFA